MTKAQLRKIFDDTAYVRTGGSAEELRAAEYLQKVCRDMDLEAYLEAFPVELAKVEEAVLTIDGKEIPCKGYLLAGSGEEEVAVLPSPDLLLLPLEQYSMSSRTMTGTLRFSLDFSFSQMSSSYRPVRVTMEPSLS